ncbi:MAG: hypothetical protein AAF289_18400, partial [Cyanobacteria bacterium P01_A01_bin.135]
MVEPDFSVTGQRRIGWLIGILLIGAGLMGSCAVAPGEGGQRADGAPGESPSQASADFDPFRKAVQQATQAADLGKTASTPADWQEIAQMWQAAQDLMQAVPESHPRYTVAQQRASEDYAANFAIAREKAGLGETPSRTADDDILTKVDFGGGWPFIIDGELRCESIRAGEYEINLVTLHSIGDVYAVNGPAQARAQERGWLSINPVWRNSEDGTAKAPINWVVMRAEASCSP